MSYIIYTYAVLFVYFVIAGLCVHHDFKVKIAWDDKDFTVKMGKTGFCWGPVIFIFVPAFIMLYFLEFLEYGGNPNSDTD